jgi:hypothetical protein
MTTQKNRTTPRKDKEHGVRARARIKAKVRHEKRLAELKSHNYVKKTK